MASVDRRPDHEAPCEGWTGEPIDGDAADSTPGMIGPSAFGADVDVPVVSGRALAVHQPREACDDHGFDPRFQAGVPARRSRGSEVVTPSTAPRNTEIPRPLVRR